MTGLRTDSMDFDWTVSSEYLGFFSFFITLLFGPVRQVNLAIVRFWVHVNIVHCIVLKFLDQSSNSACICMCKQAGFHNHNVSYRLAATVSFHR